MRIESKTAMIFPELREITIVAALTLPDMTACEDARTVTGDFCTGTCTVPFGGVTVGAGYADAMEHLQIGSGTDER